ncbi:MAG: chalcone isomerase family protein [Cocleimonas sp.]|nr:chalcone isomerase family protein [Cocleimonas sp.]
MRIISYFIVLFCLLMSSVNAIAYTAGGVTLPDKMEVSGKTLLLNGAGVRTKFVLTLYAGGLYLKAKNANANKIVQSNEVMAIRLKIISRFITSEKMITATREGFHNATSGKMAALHPQINQFMSAFKQKIVKGDEFDFVYTPTTGTQVIKNSKVLTTIKSLPFKKALFGIWLSNRPAQQSLKKEMLGEKTSNVLFD